MKRYDVCIIGAGIAGCTVAYFLSTAGKKVLVVDRGVVCGGASGAAGAFITPVMGKPSPFKEFTDAAFGFAVRFYAEFGSEFDQCGALLLPKFEKNAEEFLAIGAHNRFSSVYLSPEKLSYLKSGGKFGGYFTKDAGMLNAKAVCEKLLERTEVNEDCVVKELVQKDDYWTLNNEIAANSVVLCTGAEKTLQKEAHLKEAIRGVWGQRITVTSSARLENNINAKDIALSRTDGSSNITIGATHKQSESAKEITELISHKLLFNAQKVYELQDTEIVSALGGLRSASVDHFAIAGGIIDEKESLEKFPYLVHGKKLPANLMCYRKNLFIHTAHGSRAFMLAPYTAKLLSELILDGKALPKELDTARLFFRWAKRQGG